MSCVVLLFIFFLPYIESLAVSDASFPGAFIPVPVTPVVLPLPLLLVVLVLPLVPPPGGLAGVLTLPLPQTFHPVSFISEAGEELFRKTRQDKGTCNVCYEPCHVKPQSQAGSQYGAAEEGRGDTELCLHCTYADACLNWRLT